MNPRGVRGMVGSAADNRSHSRSRQSGLRSAAARVRKKSSKRQKQIADRYRRNAEHINSVPQIGAQCAVVARKYFVITGPSRQCAAHVLVSMVLELLSFLLA